MRGGLPIDADRLAIAITVGAASFLAVDHLAARVGPIAGSARLLALSAIVAGLVLLALHARNDGFELYSRDSAMRAGLRTRAMLACAAGCAVAVILVAASAAPGWLWSSEFGGYDAQSYHLVLAREWSFGGRTAGAIDGNVYSALPSFVECTFSRLMLLRGNSMDGAIACQWWVAFATIATAFATARLGNAIAGPLAGSAAGLTLLATPWIAVVGTLAYNDIVPCLFLAGGWLAALRLAPERTAPTAGVAAALALVATSAIGAKPTAALFVALPLLAIVLLRTGIAPVLRAPRVIATITAIVAAILAPWLVRNAMAFGNPVFPFATALLGQAHWSDEQVRIFADAHGPDAALPTRIERIFTLWIAHGFGAPPGENEPWFPQWGILPSAGLAGAALTFRRARAARSAVAALSIMLIAWVLITHLQSRFLVPTAVPLAVLCALLVGRFEGSAAGSDGHARSASEAPAQVRASNAAPAIALFLVVPTLALLVTAYLREPDKRLPLDGGRLRAPALAIGVLPQLTGESVARALETADPATRRELLATVTTPIALNVLLPTDARVIGIGFATPFYVLRPIATTTVWDRGDFDRIAAENPGSPAAWGPALRARGYTHALIDPTMLSNWATRGWLNPQLAQGAWFEPFTRANKVLLRTSEDRLLLELAPSVSAEPPAAIPMQPGQPAAADRPSP